MPGYLIVQEAFFPPHRCVGCHAHNGPFLDTLAEVPGPGGRIYLCVDCVNEATHLAGGLQPREAETAREWVQAANDRVQTLEAEIEVERENKLVSLADVKELVRQRGGRPAKPVEAA